MAGHKVRPSVVRTTRLEGTDSLHAAPLHGGRANNVRAWYTEPCLVLTVAENKEFTGACNEIQCTVSCLQGQFS